MPRRVFRRRPWIVRLGACALAAASVLAVGTPVLAGPEGACLDAEESAFLQLINDHRAANGLAPLRASQSLSAAADVHSDDMAATGYFDHTMSDGTSVERNIRNNGYTGATWGENIAGGVEGASAAMDLWRNSPAHNANMLGGNYGAIGIARVGGGTGYGWYWTTIFGGSFDAPARICGEAAPAPLLPAPDPADPSLGPGLGTTNDDVNLREGPAQTFGILQTIPPGTPLAVDGVPEGGYLPVSVGGEQGWVAEEYVDRAAVATTTDLLNFRAGPSPDASLLGTIPPGAPVTLSGAAENGYVGAAYGGQSGWVDASYVETAQEPAQPVATDAPSLPAGPKTTATTLAELGLRADPTTAAAVVATVPSGAVVDLTGQNVDGFFEVTYGGMTGWADAAYLQ